MFLHFPVAKKHSAKYLLKALKDV